MRGFQPNGIGPRDKFNLEVSHLSGKYMYSGTVSLSKPIASLVTDNDVILTGFVELGNVWSVDIDNQGIMNANDVTPSKWSDMRISIGCEIGFNFPFLPVTLAFALPMKKCDEDIVAWFHLKAQCDI